MKTFFRLLIFLWAVSPAMAQNVRISGEVRERSEFGAQGGRRFATAGDDDPIHYLRTRLGISASFQEDLVAVVQLQDARTFGEDRGNSAPAFDLRLGYIEAKNIGGTPFGIKVGRQALSYGNQRLLGEADWSNTGQMFDAAVIRAETGDLRVDLLGGVLARHPERELYARNAFLTGIWTSWEPAWLGGALHAYYLFDDPGSATIPQSRHTPGISMSASAAGLAFELDAALQLGELFGDTTSAYGGIPIRGNMIGARLWYTIDSARGIRVGGGYERISGDDPGTDIYGAFSTLYPTSHGRHGAIDFFTDIPRDTKEGGLRDIMLKASAAPLEGFSVGAELHLLSLVTMPATVAPGRDNPSPASLSIGSEIDISADYQAAEWLTIGGGYSIFQGDADRVVPPGGTTMQWGYFTATARF